MEDHVLKHRDGSIWAKGKLKEGLPTGYWRWYRLNGTIMRSGHFRDGKQVGEWITYGKDGKPFKKTDFGNSGPIPD